jgi:hypothetical protein
MSMTSPVPKQVDEATTKMVAKAVKQKAKAKAKAKPKAEAKPKRNPPVRPKADGPSGMSEKIGALASRAQGASRDELIKLSGWKQQAWRWFFTNSKGNGFCQRWGYALKVIEGKDGEVRYKIARK